MHNELQHAATVLITSDSAPLDPNRWVINPPIPQETDMRNSILFMQDDDMADLKTRETDKDVESNVGAQKHVELVVHSFDDEILVDAEDRQVLLDMDFD